MLRKTFTFLLLGFLGCFHSRAQNMLGISNGNYAGVNGIYLNPSSIADSRFGFHLNFFTANAYVSNNYYRYSGPYSLITMAQNGFKDEYNLESKYITPDNNGKNKLGVLGVDVRPLPSFMLKLSPKHSIALTARARMMFNIHNVSQAILDNIESFDPDNALNKPFSNNTGSLNINAVMETGLTYARVILNKDKHFLKGGLTVKRLSGIYSGYADVKDLDFQITETAPEEYNIRMNSVDMAYGYSRSSFEDIEDADIIDALTFKAPGNGWGFDIGMTYEYRPKIDKYRYTMDGVERLDNRKNKYKYRIGVSLMDLGSIRYQNQSHTRAYAFNRNNIDVSPDSLGEFDGETLNRVFGVKPNERFTSFKAGLPTALHLNFDYKVAGKLYVNTSIIQNLRGKYATGARNNSMASMTPRLEMKWFEVSAPLTLFDNYQNFAVGGMVRLGPLFVGSDNLMGAFGLGQAYGADVYAGLTMPIYKGKKKDKDKDGVSNRKDVCKKVPGVWEFKGCPDSDADGVEDKEDKCPMESGKKELGGCPDKDNDNITDAQDKCPEVAGLAKFNGCPDTDGDDITDAEDNCPDAAGSAALKGCPDRDGDGIIDRDDRCPDEKGLEQFKGCADVDGDGMATPDDVCPEKAGLAQFKGCPDRDGDGVQDSSDKCPDTAGSAANNGCPIEAPAVPAKVEAVKLTKEEAKVLKEAFDNLEFDNGKATIKESSLSSLDELSDLLMTRPYRLLVSGHTDNVGSAATNLKLSKSRAEAVKIYLVKTGVESTKVITEGWGSKKPVASNATPAGRQKNRRVEMKVIK